jgi:hypothetical protein
MISFLYNLYSQISFFVHDILLYARKKDYFTSKTLLVIVALIVGVVKSL